MIRRILGLLICVAMFPTASLALAGGPVSAPPPYAYGSVKPYGPATYGPGRNPCRFWGDAPFPGMCGGVIALPFLVVGSLLGGNPAGPCGPPPRLRYNCAPKPCPPRRYYRPYGFVPRYGPAYARSGMLGGLPPIELATDLISSVTGGAGVL